VASIEPTRLAECQCISVSHPDHLYVTDDYIVTHNTALAINIAEHVALHEGLPVAVFSMEMGASQLAVRIVGSIGRINQSHLRTGALTDDEWPRLTEAIEKLRTISLHIDETAGLRVPGLPAYVCHISHPDPKSLMSLSGKQERAPQQWIRQKRLTVASIAPARLAECQCISVSHPDHLYVTDDYIVTHNTALAINIAEHVALHEGLPVAVFSMEMGASQLAVRIVGSIGRIDQTHLRTGALTDEEWPRLTEAIEKLRSISLHIDETAGLTVSELRANARRLARQCGKLGLIVVDYLQLMSVSTSMSDENRATAVGEISRGLKMLAKELQCPVIALSQLSRGVESRTDKRPMMSDLRESGAIEQDADIIMFIYRDEYYTKEACKEPGVAEVIISKQRNGPTGTVKLAFINRITKFESLAHSSGDF
jgi:replicative DNA helicase